MIISEKQKCQTIAIIQFKGVKIPGALLEFDLKVGVFPKQSESGSLLLEALNKPEL